MEMYQELHEFIAKELMEQRRQDIGANYEINQAFSELAIQQQAETLDPDNRDCYVCARCKNNVARRIKESKIICEKPGCFEIDLHYNGFSVEQVMIAIQCILEDHKKENVSADSKCKG